MIDNPREHKAVLNNARKHRTALGSASELGTVLDSAVKHDMDAMALCETITLCDVTMTNYDKFLILLMQISCLFFYLKLLRRLPWLPCGPAPPKAVVRFGRASCRERVSPYV